LGVRLIERLSEEQVRDLHGLYQAEWWTHRRNVDDVARMLEGSNVVLGFEDEESGRLIGFARVITDFVYKALVLDVIVAASHRGTGTGKALMDAVIEHPELKDVLHFELYCRPELVPFYERWGFTDQLGELRFMRRGTSPAPPS
jgi:GNAT superfamily N-acetyltransferase